jgi:hypothetical protein
VCYFRLGNPAGYVIHAQTDNWVHQVLIGVGPFFLNSVLGALFTFPSALRIGGLSIIELILTWLGVSIAMHAIPSTGDAKSMWLAVSGQQTSLLAKCVVAPIVGLIFLLALGSFVWLDLLYGIAVSLALPTLLVNVLA